MGGVDQVTFAELMKDPIYAKWFAKPPFAADYARWRVYVKKTRKGGWAKRDFGTWKKAYKFVVKYHEQWYDCVLICRNEAFRPPVITVPAKKEVNGKEVKYQKREYYIPLIRMDGHRWCGYCRRPTIFTWFTKHHAFTTMSPLPYFKRCSVCGIAENAVKHY